MRSDMPHQMGHKTISDALLLLSSHALHDGIWSPTTRTATRIRAAKIEIF